MLAPRACIERLAVGMINLGVVVPIDLEAEFIDFHVGLSISKEFVQSKLTNAGPQTDTLAISSISHSLTFNQDRSEPCSPQGRGRFSGYPAKISPCGRNAVRRVGEMPSRGPYIVIGFSRRHDEKSSAKK
jgi:hypothetical protein